VVKSIIQKIFNNEKTKPIAVQCLWNSDWEYIGLTIDLIFKKNDSYSKQNITELEYQKFETEEALLQEAEKITKAYTEKYDIQLYFPSPDKWSRDCPNYWESKTSPKCEDCKTPIIPTKSIYLPKEVCYPCHLEREQNKRITNEEQYDDGVKMYLSKNDKYENIGYCSYFKDFTIASFINDKVQKQFNENVINVVTLHKSDILELNEDLEKALNKKLAVYEKPVIREAEKNFIRTHKVEYNGIEYELSSRLNNDHYEISNLISALKTNQKALQNDYVYEIYFKKGFTHRDDSVLRFVNYVCKGSSSIEKIMEKYKDVMSKTEISTTINKLIKIGCLVIHGNFVTVTTAGKNIV
jgi:hypothetical protein